MTSVESAPKAPEAPIEEDKPALVKEPNAVELEAPEAPIEDEKAISIAPEALAAPIEEEKAAPAVERNAEESEASEAPIEEEKVLEIAPEATETPTQEDVPGPGEDLSFQHFLYIEVFAYFYRQEHQPQSSTRIWNLRRDRWVLRLHI